MMSVIQRTQNRNDQELQISHESLCFSDGFKKANEPRKTSDGEAFDVNKIFNHQCLAVNPESDLCKYRKNLFFKLNEINISGYGLTKIPNAMFDLKYLTVLNLSNNFLESLPKEISCLCNLVVLILCGNNLNCLPKSIKFIQQLNYLDLSCNKFSKVPDVLYYGLRFLQILDLSCNEITEFSDPLGCLNKLTVLRLSDNFLEKIPVWLFDNLCKLQFLDISQNKLHIDIELINYCNTGVFESLQSLNVHNCNLRHEIIQIISFFKNLKVLYLGNKKDVTHKSKGNNFLGNLKIEAFKNFGLIRELYLPSVQIATLPKNFDCFKNVEILDLSDNLLSWLPECICDLASLKILNFTSNQMLFLPANIGNLVNLEQIHLGFNKLSDIPDSFYTLANVEYIDLYNNQIEKVHYCIFTKKKLKGIDLELNCLKFNFSEANVDVDEIKVLYNSLKESFRKQFCYLNTRNDLQVTKLENGLDEVSNDTHSLSTINSLSPYESAPSSDMEDSFGNISKQNYYESEDWEKRESDHSEEDESFDPNKVDIFQEQIHSWSLDFQSNYCPANYHVPSVMKTYLTNFKLASENEDVEEGQFDSD